jgi:hypothetical protein
MAAAISRSSRAELLDELAAQNQELITTLDQLNNQPDRAGSLAIPPRRERDRPRHRLANWIRDEDLYFSCFPFNFKLQDRCRADVWRALIESMGKDTTGQRTS